MVCELPPEIKRIIDRHKECSRTESLVGRRTRVPGRGVWAGYNKDCIDIIEGSMKRVDAELLGSGAHRIAFGYDDCVVKVALGDDKRALDANKSEARSWKALPMRAKRLFIPVDRHDMEGWWLTQPMADTEENPDEDMLDELHDDIEKLGLDCVDIHGANVGYWKGNWRVLDYGFGVEGCKLRPPPRPHRPTGQRTIPMFARRR